MKIKKMMIGLSATLCLLVLAISSGFADPGTPAVSVTGGPTAVTIPANATSPTTLTPAFTLVNTNTAYPVEISSVKFTSSDNYTVTNPILLTGCTYNGLPAIPALGQGTCTATVQLTGANPTSSPVNGMLTVKTSAGTATSLPVSITVAGSSSPATWILDATSLSPSQPISVGDTVTAQYTLTNTDTTNSLTFSNPVAGFSGTAGVLDNEQILNSGNNNCESLSGILLARQSCIYLVQATGAAVGTANITLDVTTNGTGGPTSPVLSAPITVQTSSTGGGVVWSLAANSTSINLQNNQTKTIYFAVDNQEPQSNLNIVGVPTVHITGIDPSSVTATFDTIYPSSGSPGTGCPTSSGAALIPGVCYYAVDVEGAATGMATINLGVLTSNGASAGSNCSTENGNQGCYASTDVAVGEASNTGPLTVSPSTSPISITAGDNNKNQNSVVYTVNIPGGTTVGTEFTITDVKILTEPKDVKNPSLSPSVQVCNQNDGSNCSGTNGPSGTLLCNGGLTNTIGEQVAGVPNSCTLNLLAYTKVPGTYKTTLQVDYTQNVSGGDNIPYISYSEPVIYNAASAGVSGLIFTQEPMPPAFMDPSDSTPQTLTYQVKNTDLTTTYYINPQFVLNSINKPGTLTTTTQNGSQALYAAGSTTVVSDCGNTIDPDQKCNITVTLPAPSTQQFPFTPILYDEFLSIPYGTTPDFTQQSGVLNAPITFQIISMKNARQLTFVNNCAEPFNLGLASATVPNAVTTNPKEPNNSCASDDDCFPGTHCVLTQANDAASGQCYYLNPVPVPAAQTQINQQNQNNNPYNLSENGGTSTVTIPQQQLNVSYPGNALQSLIMNLTIAARAGCTPGHPCSISDCSDANNYKGGGNFMPGWACASSGSVAPPGTLAEINFGDGSLQTQDHYDESVINGYTVPISLAPDSSTPCAGTDGTNPYTCGTAGDTEDQTLDNQTIGASSWIFDWLNAPASTIGGYKFGDTDLPYLTLVSAGGEACTSSSRRVKGNMVCGVSVNSMRAITTPKGQPALTYGKFLGYWSPAQACISSNGNAGSPYFCGTSITDGVTQTTSTLNDLYQCTGALGNSCYGGTSSGVCCGCVNWGGSSGAPTDNDNPFGNLPVPVATSPTGASTIVQYCGSYNTAFLYGSSSTYGTSNPVSPTTAYPALFYNVLKTGVPSVYTYQFDDMSSSFTGSTEPTSESTGATATNFVNYTVTFCPGQTASVPSAFNPDSAAVLAQEQQEATKVQAVKAKAKQAQAQSSGTLVSNAVSKLKSLGAWAPVGSDQ